MVKVTRAAPSLTGIVGSRHFIFFCSGSSIVVLADVGQSELIGHSLIGLSGEIHP